MTESLCRAEAKLTDAEIAEIVRASVPPSWRMIEPFEGFRTSAVCDLEAGHTGSHASLQAYGSKNVAGDPWLLWDGQRRDIAWLADCPAEDGYGETCNLFTGHAGGHLAWVWDVPGLVAPSWAYGRGDERGLVSLPSGNPPA